MLHIFISILSLKHKKSYNEREAKKGRSKFSQNFHFFEIPFNLLHVSMLKNGFDTTLTNINSHSSLFFLPFFAREMKKGNFDQFSVFKLVFVNLLLLRLLLKADFFALQKFIVQVKPNLSLLMIAKEFSNKARKISFYIINYSSY
jgi:hypothetical protein